MFAFFRLLPILCASSGLWAQSVNDLNSLVLQAHRFAVHDGAGRKCQRDLNLFKIIGTGGGPGDWLMQTTLDLQQWTLVFQISPADAPAPAMAEGAAIAQSVQVQCKQGMFTETIWSPLPVFDCKSMEWAWLALSLDEAIAQLNRLGFTRGFTSLTVMRPLYPRYPDVCTYVFKCAPDHAYVGISAQTGKELWTEAIPG